jgi:hypothetical protein
MGQSAPMWKSNKTKRPLIHYFLSTTCIPWSLPQLPGVSTIPVAPCLFFQWWNLIVIMLTLEHALSGYAVSFATDDSHVSSFSYTTSSPSNNNTSIWSCPAEHFGSGPGSFISQSCLLSYITSVFQPQCAAVAFASLWFTYCRNHFLQIQLPTDLNQFSPHHPPNPPSLVQSVAFQATGTCHFVTRTMVANTGTSSVPQLDWAQNPLWLLNPPVCSWWAHVSACYYVRDKPT